MTRHLPRVDPGDPVSAETFNALIDAVNQLLGLSVAFPLEAHRTAGGMHLQLASWPQLKIVTLAEDLATRDFDKTANVLDYDAASALWRDTTGEASFTPQVIGSLTDRTDAGLYLQSERHLAYFDPESGRYVPIAPPGPHLAKAIGEIDQGEDGLVRVYQVEDDAEAESSQTLAVHNWMHPRVWDGSPCWIEFHPQSRRWYLTAAHSAKLLRGKQVGDLLTTDTTNQIDDLVALCGHFPIADSSTSVTAANLHAWEADDRADTLLAWNDASAGWEMVQVTCPQ